ncbi:MAG: toxin-antitoxin system HicB family antitoxin [Candidatus Omnitrophica bacterium]|jgi:predicted RNase H-like HicB family nuclease|nr:type II toxin-antitoxin system HicB family antitoxin [Candidatus Omnitrophota bacterium]MDD5078892.1 toxin-antitoxin system HicB family antitoxin [Candidatus Omnitrophota bacterium]
MGKYSINIVWSDEDAGFIATIPEFKNLSAFGNTYEEALKEAETVLEGYIESLKAENVPLPEPHKISEYSGQTRLRMPRDLHQAIALGAQRQGVSQNTYMVMLLSMNYTINSMLPIIEHAGEHIFITRVSSRGVDNDKTYYNPLVAHRNNLVTNDNTIEVKGLNNIVRGDL